MNPELNSNSIATKFDQDKVRYELIPIYALHEVAQVMTYGAKKYKENNWRNGFTYMRLIGALWRHTAAFVRGETIDPETGLHHLGHAAVNCLMLVDFYYTGEGIDDRRAPSLGPSSRKH